MFDSIFLTKTKKRRVIAKRKSKTPKRLEWHADTVLTQRVRGLVDAIEFSHIPKHRIFSFRTDESRARAYSSTRAFPKIFQTVLEIEPAYVIEVLNKYYNKLTEEEKTKVLIHELLHIPRNFSGSLLPHLSGYKTIEREVDKIYREMKGRE